MDLPQNKSGLKTGEMEVQVDAAAQNQILQEQVIIENLPLEKKIEIVKKISYQDQYEVGRFIDAMDTVNQWCLGEIVGIEQRTLNIHFDGWSSKWDLFYKMNSVKVAPFRKYSRGYTGQVKIALRKQQFNLEDLQKEKDTVERLIAGNLNGLGAFETTQYLRGKLYIYVDFLMGQPSFNEESVDAVIDFLNTVIRLIITWLRKLPSLIPLFAQVKINSDLYMIDENIAIMMSYYELFDILKKLFCCCHRATKFYFMYDKNAIQHPNMVTIDLDNFNFEKKRCSQEDEYDVEEMKSRIMARQNLVYGQFINFINYFNMQGGFDALIQVLKVGNEHEDKIPIELISIMTSPFRNCNQIFSKQFSEIFVKQVKESVFDRIKHMNEKEIKEIDKELVSNVLNEMKDFLNLHYTDIETSELVESNQLFIAHRFLKSSYLEKRLKGLNHIKHMIDRIEAQQKLQQHLNEKRFRNDIDQEMNGGGNNQMINNSISTGKFKQPLKWLTAEYLKDWIINQRVLETVLGESTHLEIVKRSGCILKFLSKLGALPQDAIELIWKCQLGKHEEMVRVIYNIIRELVPFISQEQVDLIYSKIQTVQPKQFDEKYLLFLKDFTLKALESNYESKNNETSINENQPLDYSQVLDQREQQVLLRFKEHLGHSNKGLVGDEKLYGLPIFWELIQDKLVNTVSTEMMDNCIESITEILKSNYCKQIRLSYVIRCVENLKKGESILQSIVIIQAIINQYPENKFSNEAATQQEFICQVEQEAQIIEVTIHNIIKYYQTVKDKLKNIDKSKLNEDFSNHIFAGRHSHQLTINKTLEFLEFLIIQSNLKVSLGEKNIETLWNLFVQQPNLNLDQTIFLKWINKQREYQYRSGQEYYIFTDEEKKYFFVKILCNPTYIDYKTMTISLVKCFQKYFKDINKQEENLLLGRKALRVVNFSNLIGLDTLWQICIECQNEKVKEESIDLLVDLHLKFDFNNISYEQQRVIWEDFINKCMSKIEQGDAQQISNAINLISKFLDRYDGKKSVKADLKQVPQYSNISPLNILVFNKTDQSRKNVTITYFQTLGALRQKIGEAFNYQLSEFSMIYKNSIIDPDEDDDKYIKDIGGNFNQMLIQRNVTYIPDNHPKNIIANNQQYFDKLFSLLSSDQNKFIQPVWDLLMKLPINIRLQQELHNLTSVQQDLGYWSQLLDPQSTYKLLYSLRIINGLISDKKDQKTIIWRNNFTALKGPFHLLNTFIELNIKKIENPLTMKCIELLIQLINEFIYQDKIILAELLNKKEQFFHKCISLLDMICDYSIKVEEERGEAYEVINKRNQLNKMMKNKFKAYAQGNKGGDKKQNQQQQQQQQQNQQNDDDDDSENSDAQLLQQYTREFMEQTKLVQTIFQFLIQGILNYDNQAIVLLTQYENLQDLFFKGLFRIENFILRNEIGKRFVILISQRSGQPEMQKLLPVIETILFKLQENAEKYETRCSSYYECASSLVDSVNQSDLKVLEVGIQRLIVTLSKDILSREIIERNQQTPDIVLCGKMKLLKSLLQKFSQSKEPIGKMLLNYLLHECLFEITNSNKMKSKKQIGFPKCKSIQSRQNCAKLISVLCRDCIPNLHTVLNYLKIFNESPSWRTNKDHDWNIQLRDTEKSTTGFVGIKNLGCICYMNSLFQQLFMIPSFRTDILSVKNNNNEEKEENMLYQLQLLWTGLLKSEKMYVTPKGFCHAFKDYDGQPTNVLEQMDVDEFLNLFLDRLETAIKGTPYERTIQKHFGGLQSDQMICKGCPHSSERSQPFLALSLQVKNKKTIEDALETFIQSDMLEGDNAYLCEKCDKKVDTEKRTVIKKLPKYLIFALKRFEFDLDRMIRVKVNDYFEFPMELDMEPYTLEGLARREKAAKKKEGKGEEGIDEAQDLNTTSASNNTSSQNEQNKYPAEYYTYKLTGTVVHTGTAESGHYYSFIKDKDDPQGGKWYEMNDKLVSDFDPNEIPNETYGGEDTFQGYNMVQMKSMKWRNAYLLFYERKTLDEVDAEDDEEEAKKQSNQQQQDIIMQNSQQNQSMSEIEAKIAYENQKYWQNRFLFAQEYHDLVYDISLNWNQSLIIPKNFLTKNDDFHIIGEPMPLEYASDTTIQDPFDIPQPLSNKYSQEDILGYEHEVFKLAAGYYIGILQRSYAKLNIPINVNLLKSYMNKNVNNAKWLLEEFCNEAIIEENLLQNSSREMRKLLTGILYCAMLKVYPEEKDKLNLYWTQPDQQQQNITVLGNFILILIKNLYDVKRFVQNNQQYFLLLARFSSLGPEAREFLLRARIVGRLMDYYFEDASPFKEEFKSMADIVVLYKAKPDIGLPTSIDKKQMSYFQEIIEKRRQKQLADATPKYKYLIETISNCIRAVKMGPTRTPYQLDDYPEPINSIERDLFIPDPKFLRRIISDATKNRSIGFICKTYCHYSWFNNQAYENLLKTILIGLNDYDYDHIRPFLMMAQFMLEKPSNYSNGDIYDLILTQLMISMQQNKGYFKFMETMFDFIFKITSKIEAVRQWFLLKKDQWEWLIEWNQEFKLPPNPISQNQNIRLYKKRNMSMNMMLNQNYKNDMKAQFLFIYRQYRLQKLKDGVVIDTSNEVDLDLVDMQDHKFVVGENSDQYVKKTEKLNSITVVQVLDEMINFRHSASNDDNVFNWQSKDYDKLLPKGALQSQLKTKYIDALYQQQEQRKQAQGNYGYDNQMQNSEEEDDSEDSGENR